MATRVRKIAKELKLTPDAVLGLLRALGYDRFRKTEDMVSDKVLRQLKAGIRDGLKPVNLDWGKSVPEASKPAPIAGIAAKRVSFGDDHLDMSLTDFISAGTNKRDPVKTVSRPAVPKGEPVGVPMPARKPEQEFLLSEATHRLNVLTEENQGLLDTIGQLRQENANLTTSLEEASQSIHEAQETSQSVLLSDALHQRGLRGLDEMERAMEALLRLRIGRQWMSTIEVNDPATFGTLLHEKFVLVEGESESLSRYGKVAVIVSGDRAERVGDETLRTAVDNISEGFLLLGLRKVLIFGKSCEELRFLRDYVDSRIHLFFKVIPAVMGEALQEELGRYDCVVLWEQIEEEPQALPSEGRGKLLVRLTESSLQNLAKTLDGLMLID